MNRPLLELVLISYISWDKPEGEHSLSEGYAAKNILRSFKAQLKMDNR